MRGKTAKLNCGKWSGLAFCLLLGKRQNRPPPPAHVVQLTLKERLNEVWIEDMFYNKMTTNGIIVAKCHAWDYMGIYPPQRKNCGWKNLILRAI